MKDAFYIRVCLPTLSLVTATHPTTRQVLIQARPFSDGAYEDKEYCKWVHQGDPPLPPRFVSRFQETGIVLKLKANNEVHKTSFDEAAESCVCTIC